jgi:uncharacterized protein YbaP (TraB family)
MKRAALLVLASLAFACRGGGAAEPTRPTPGSAGSAIAARGSAVGSAATDPWAGPGVEPDAPTLAERKHVVDEACPAVTAPYFFALAKDGKTSYILGTRHVSVALREFPPVVVDKLRGAHLAVFEIDPKADKGKIDAKPPDGPSLEAQLGAKRWAKLVALVGSSSAAELVHAKPSEAMLVMMAMYEDPSRLLESDIERVAAQGSIPTGGLESAEFQDGLLDKLLDVRMLSAALDNTDNRNEFRDETTRDLHSYCTGADYDPGMDPKTRRQLLAAGYTEADIAAIDEQLVFARNRDWIPKLEQLFGSGQVFVAVGADHLVGTRGVIALLAKHGYTATRLK